MNSPADEIGVTYFANDEVGRPQLFFGSDRAGTSVGLELFFSSKRAGGFGDFDIWVVMRETLFTPWSEPVNPGPDINTPMFDAGPAISSNGLRLAFYQAENGLGTIRISTRTKLHGQ